MNDRPQPGRHSTPDDSSAAPAMIAGRAPTIPPAPGAPRMALRLLPLALGAVAGVLLVIIGASLFARRSGAVQPAPVTPIARQICADLTTQRYSDLYGLFSRAQKAIGTSDQFAATQRQLDAQLGAAHTCAYTVTLRDAKNATLTLTLTRGTSAAASAQVDLIVEQEGWRIAGYDSSLVAAPGGYPSLASSPL